MVPLGTCGNPPGGGRNPAESKVARNAAPRILSKQRLTSSAFCDFASSRREGLETGEFEGTKIAAHSIKGSAAVFGATELSEAAKVLEHAVKVRAGASNAILTQKQSSDHHLILSLFAFVRSRTGIRTARSSERWLIP